MKLQVCDAQGITMDALYFGDIEQFLAYLQKKYGENTVQHMMKGYKTGMKLAFTYYPTVNEYMGRRSLQIVIQNYQ